ncbi:MAG TPA: peptide chain release factor-like protein [Phycisphaerales bacterium]|nr:peptide chain release factor-like protein [Phycisphaerales bacterium]
MGKRESKPAPSQSAEEAWLASLDARITAQTRGEKKSQDKQKAAEARIKHAPVVIVPRPHPATLAIDDLLRQCTIGKSRSGGPGGQNRNKVETTVTLTHEPSGIEAHAGERRTSMENRRMAISRLRLALAVQARCSVPTGDARSDLWKSRCRHERIVIATTHEDFPAILGEALDFIFACNLDVKLAAARLCCSTSQLVKLLKDHPPALVWLNALRAAEGMRELK